MKPFFVAVLVSIHPPLQWRCCWNSSHKVQSHNSSSFSARSWWSRMELLWFHSVWRVCPSSFLHHRH
jgi:hypothetical protein